MDKVKVHLQHQPTRRFTEMLIIEQVEFKTDCLLGPNSGISRILQQIMHI